MEEIKNTSENEEISEENLEEVAGGEITKSGSCFFQPEVPYQYTKKHGAISVKCKSTCRSFILTCKCYDTLLCVDKWHLMEEDKSIPKRWYPTPRDRYNHVEGDKVVSPLDATYP